MYQKILVPIDGSETAALGLNEAIRLAKNQGAKIRLMHVVNEMILTLPEAYVDLDRVVESARCVRHRTYRRKAVADTPCNGTEIAGKLVGDEKRED